MLYKYLKLEGKIDYINAVRALDIITNYDSQSAHMQFNKRLQWHLNIAIARLQYMLHFGEMLIENDIVFDAIPALHKVMNSR